MSADVPNLGVSSAEPPLRNLPASLWLSIFAFLEVEDVRMASQVCREWRAIGGDDLLWRKLAARLWPERTLLSGSYGGSFRRLVLHGNCRNAVAAMPLAPAACLWRPNALRNRYYACRFLHLELQPHFTDAGPALLRLFFDARGERDLRQPRLTSLLVVTLRDGNSQPQPQPHQVPEGPGAAAGGNGAAAWALAPETLELGPEPQPLWQRLHTAELPTACCLVTNVQGHFKGCLEWTGPALARLLHHLDKPEASLLAVYACDLRGYPPEDPYAFRNGPDYAPAVLWRGVSCSGDAFGVRARPAAGSSFLRSWRRRAEYHAPGELLQRLADEDDAAERARWADSLPPWVAAREQGWWVRERAPGGRVRGVGPQAPPHADPVLPDPLRQLVEVVATLAGFPAAHGQGTQLETRHGRPRFEWQQYRDTD
ncbi:hypothetical protein PLESTB_000627800 [Pleodorina starrii]|uniref:F-box domain-containing protein n=1 Tax=Pleodorina starrii TaxID=330485 RepID=A0A9W6F1K6_9CHLO|nr:hypothetical protein PLESTB_000627800 [Pleodorina starrii]